jgi:DNA-binding MarR family transcriptional regulator
MAFAKVTLKLGQFRLGYLVHDVSRLRRTVIDKALKPLGITRSQWWVLANLTRHEGGGVTQAELAKLLDVGKVALGGLLDRIEANGYITRRAVPEDRRANLVKITKAGAALIASIQGRAAALNQEMMRGISAEEILLVEDILHRMKIRLIEMDNETRGKPDLQVLPESDFPLSADFIDSESQSSAVVARSG